MEVYRLFVCGLRQSVEEAGHRLEAVAGVYSLFTVFLQSFTVFLQSFYSRFTVFYSLFTAFYRVC
jgi:hypothetical protein